MAGALGLAAAVAGGLAARAQTPISPTDAPVVLFNGKDLSSFTVWMRDQEDHRADLKKNFTVEKESGQPVLHILGDGYGGLVTKDEYTNYRLVAEYRWGERTWGDRANSARDNGILIHGIGPAGGSLIQRVNGVSPWISSFEYQIIEGGVGDFLVLSGEPPYEVKATVDVELRPSGRSGQAQPFWKKAGTPRQVGRGANRVNWFDKDPNLQSGKGTRGANDVDTPGQGWTRLECIADGTRLTYIVNGVTVMEAYDVSPSAGKIQIQTEQAEIFYRRIELLPLKR
jgi:hypothetical protein